MRKILEHDKRMLLGELQKTDRPPEQQKGNDRCESTMNFLRGRYFAGLER